MLTLIVILLAALDPVAPYPSPPRPRAPMAFNSDQDYPLPSLRAYRQGRTGYRVHVSAKGRVTDCSIIGSSGAADLDAQTCRLVRKRMTFEPARRRRL